MDDEVSLFFFFVMPSNVGDTLIFLRSAPNVNVVRISNTPG